jgi:adenine deaminase
MAYDLVIRNGTVIDGTGSSAYEADVAVEGGKRWSHRGSSMLTPTWISFSFSIPMEIRW